MKDVSSPTYSVEDYFHLVEEASEKYEYISGEVKMMAGGTHNHNVIVSNANRMLGNQLLHQPCAVYSSDMQLVSSNSDAYFFPDVMVACGDIDFDGDNMTRIKNPILIIEVLSPSTSKYDQTEKFRYYAEIPSLKEYILIHSDKIMVQGFYKEQKSLWKISNAYKMEQSIAVLSLGLSLSIKDLYLKTIGIIE